MQKRIYTACCITRLPLALYCTNDTAITPTFAISSIIKMKIKL